MLFDIYHCNADVCEWAKPMPTVGIAWNIDRTFYWLRKKCFDL